MFVFDRTAACTRYVAVRTCHCYVDSHFNFGRLQLDLVTFIRLFIRATCSSVGSGECLFWMKRTLVHGTFGCGRVTTMWILTLISVACNWILSRSLDYV
jgi:hypothetical protein